MLSIVIGVLAVLLLRESRMRFDASRLAELHRQLSGRLKQRIRGLLKEKKNREAKSD
jgi:hypothetical protein